MIAPQGRGRALDRAREVERLDPPIVEEVALRLVAEQDEIEVGVWAGHAPRPGADQGEGPGRGVGRGHLADRADRRLDQRAGRPAVHDGPPRAARSNASTSSA